GPLTLLPERSPRNNEVEGATRFGRMCDGGDQLELGDSCNQLRWSQRYQLAAPCVAQRRRHKKREGAGPPLFVRRRSPAFCMKLTAPTRPSGCRSSCRPSSCRCPPSLPT